MDPFAAGPQPAGRTPAPGRLGLVQAFTNSFWDLDGDGTDEWADLAGFRAWQAARGFGGAGGESGAGDRARALTLREALRRLALGHHEDGAPDAADLAVLDALAAGTPLRLRFAAGVAPQHEPAADGPDALLALVLGVVAEAMADGTWTRVKACPGPHCGWLFYDASRNRASHWCSMRICGNRAKGREFRARRRDEE